MKNWKYLEEYVQLAENQDLKLTKMKTMRSNNIKKNFLQETHANSE